MIEFDEYFTFSTRLQSANPWDSCYGCADSKVQLASYTTGPQELKLHLDPSLASLYIVATCCSYDYQSKKVSY